MSRRPCQPQEDLFICQQDQEDIRSRKAGHFGSFRYG